MIGKISQKGAFDRLAREGRTARARGLWVSALTDSTTGTANVAYAVGRRAGNAVRRNHIKRRLRHAVRHQAGRLSPGWYLVGVSAGIAELSFDELEVTLGRLLGEVQQ